MEGERKKAEGEAKRRMEQERRAFAEARKSMVNTAVHHVKHLHRKHTLTLNRSINSIGLRLDLALREIIFINQQQKIKLIQT